MTADRDWAPPQLQMAPMHRPVPYGVPYRPWGAVPHGWGAPPYGGWNSGWGNGWMPWGNSWGGNSWWPWSGWGNDGWNRGYGSGWGDGWGNTWGDGAGDAAGAADFSFAMRAQASGNMRGQGYGDGWLDGRSLGYGYQGYGPHPGYWGGPWAPAAPSAPAVEEGPADADRDGVTDAVDLCPDTAEGATVDAFGCAESARIVLRGVNFKTDSDELTPESLAILDGVSQTLAAHPDIRVVVAGHTDSDGEAAYNKDLSQRRAQAVVEYLAGQGVERNNMIAKGYGEEQPIADNDSAEGKAQNRRVELNRL